MKRFGVIVLFVVCTAIVGSVNVGICAAQTGYVFDIQGTAQLKAADGKTIVMKRSAHLLYPIKDGDRIKVDKGKVVVASLKDGTGYEIGDNTEAVAKLGKMAAVKGKVVELKGLHAPGKTVSGPMGGFVVRSMKPCIKALSPVNTTILELTPSLVWDNTCSGDKKVTVKVISGEKVIFSSQTDARTLKVPEKVLAYGGEYRWIVDSGKANNVSGGVFTLPPEAEADVIAKKIAGFEQHKTDLSMRLSYVFYLIDLNLNDRAKAEVKALKAEFPDNEYLKKIEDGIR